MGNLGWFLLWLPDQERGKITAGASDAPCPKGVDMVGSMFTAGKSFGTGTHTTLLCLILFELSVPPLPLIILSASMG